jgi:TatA/E family protein of Tat protein translocase
LNHWPWLIALGVIALIVFGPKRLPELGEGLGKAIREFRKATSEMGESLRGETHHSDTATGTTYTPPVEPAPPVQPAPPATTAASPPPVATATTPPPAAAPPEPPKP